MKSLAFNVTCMATSRNNCPWRDSRRSSHASFCDSSPAVSSSFFFSFSVAFLVFLLLCLFCVDRSRFCESFVGESQKRETPALSQIYGAPAGASTEPVRPDGGGWARAVSENTTERQFGYPQIHKSDLLFVYHKDIKKS